MESAGLVLQSTANPDHASQNASERFAGGSGPQPQTEINGATPMQLEWMRHESWRLALLQLRKKVEESIRSNLAQRAQARRNLELSNVEDISTETFFSYLDTEWLEKGLESQITADFLVLCDDIIWRQIQRLAATTAEIERRHDVRNDWVPEPYVFPHLDKNDALEKIMIAELTIQKLYIVLSLVEKGSSSQTEKRLLVGLIQAHANLNEFTRAIKELVCVQFCMDAIEDTERPVLLTWRLMYNMIDKVEMGLREWHSEFLKATASKNISGGAAEWFDFVPNEADVQQAPGAQANYGAPEVFPTNEDQPAPSKCHTTRFNKGRRPGSSAGGHQPSRGRTAANTKSKTGPSADPEFSRRVAASKTRTIQLIAEMRARSFGSAIDALRHERTENSERPVSVPSRRESAISTTAASLEKSTSSSKDMGSAQLQEGLVADSAATDTEVKTPPSSQGVQVLATQSQDTTSTKSVTTAAGTQSITLESIHSDEHTSEAEQPSLPRSTPPISSAADRESEVIMEVKTLDSTENTAEQQLPISDSGNVDASTLTSVVAAENEQVSATSGGINQGTVSSRPGSLLVDSDDENSSEIRVSTGEATPDAVWSASTIDSIRESEGSSSTGSIDQALHHRVLEADQRAPEVESATSPDPEPELELGAEPRFELGLEPEVEPTLAHKQPSLMSRIGQSIKNIFPITGISNVASSVSASVESMVLTGYEPAEPQTGSDPAAERTSEQQLSGVAPVVKPLEYKSLEGFQSSPRRSREDQEDSLGEPGVPQLKRIRLLVAPQGIPQSQLPSHSEGQDTCSPVERSSLPLIEPVQPLVKRQLRQLRVMNAGPGRRADPSRTYKTAASRRGRMSRSRGVTAEDQISVAIAENKPLLPDMESTGLTLGQLLNHIRSVVVEKSSDGEDST